jgi:tetraacyldisaccharide 4'-kinase
VAAARALERHGVSVIVLDDGLQHRRLARDVDLAVVDGRYPNARGLFPMGEGREEAIPERIHGVIVHHGQLDAQSNHAVATASRRFGPWHRGAQVSDLPPGPVFAFAGIARPADFLDSLSCDVVEFRALADHQPVGASLAAALIRQAAGRPMVCTDKDHSRLPTAMAAQTWWRTVELDVHGALESWFPPSGR